MLPSHGDFLVRQEQYQDLLREAEKGVLLATTPTPAGYSLTGETGRLACTHQCGIIWLGNPKNRTEPRLMATALRR
jgi:hypothetical protein